MDLFGNISTLVGKGVEGEILVLQQDVDRLKEEKGLLRPKRVINKTVSFGFVSTETREVLPGAAELDGRIQKKESMIQMGEEYLKKCLRLSSRLSVAGIHGASIMPRALFNEICGKADLFRFQNIASDGRVAAKTITNSKVLAEGFVDFVLNFETALIFMGIVSFLFGLSVVSSALILVGAFSFLFFAREFDGDEITLKGVSFFLISVTAYVGAISQHVSAGIFEILIFKIILSLGFIGPALYLLFGVLCFVLRLHEQFEGSNIEYFPEEKILIFAVKMYHRLIPHKTLLTKLWPEKCDSGISNSQNSQTVLVRFPKAPETFLRNIEKVRGSGWRVCIAADSGAIYVDNEDLVGDLKKELKNARDPILYVVDDDLVAIIDQFGEFPNEKKVMEFVREKGTSFVFN